MLGQTDRQTDGHSTDAYYGGSVKTTRASYDCGLVLQYLILTRNCYIPQFASGYTAVLLLDAYTHTEYSAVAAGRICLSNS